jgi:putative SOS response-associated peptidase YedK
VCNLYSITTNQAAIATLFRVMNRYVGNLAPMPGVFPDYPAPVVRNTEAGTEMTLMRWGMPPPPQQESLFVWLLKPFFDSIDPKLKPSIPHRSLFAIP